MSAHPEGWAVRVRRTSGQIFTVAGVPFGLFVNNLFIALAIGAAANLPLAAVAQFLALHALFRFLTARDPWWYGIVMQDVSAALVRLARTRRRHGALMDV